MQNPKLELVSIMKESKIGDDLESEYVAGMIWHHRKTKDIFPKITEHQGLSFASRTLVSVGFFKKYMEHLNEFHGAPDPKFYLRIASAEFYAEGKFKIANHLEDWTNYLHERFKIKNKKTKEIEIPIYYKTSRYHRSFPNSLKWKALGPLN